MVGNVGSQSTKGHEGQKISTKGHEGTRRKTKRKKIPRTDASCPAPLVPRATRPRPASQGHSTPKNVSPTPLSGFANHGSPWGGDWWVFSRVGECGADHSRKNGRSLMKANHEWTRINTNRPEDRGPPSTTSGTKMVLQFCDLGVTGHGMTKASVSPRGCCPGGAVRGIWRPTSRNADVHPLGNSRLPASVVGKGVLVVFERPCVQ